MNKFITVAALLAAGTAFANADGQTFTTTPVQSGLSLQGGRYTGFSFSLADLSMEEGEYTLDSLKVFSRYSNSSNTFSGAETLVVYSLSGSTLSFLGAGTTTADTSSSSATREASTADIL